MTARLAAGVLVSALVRQTQAAGGSAMVLAKGDAQAGAILLLLARRGVAGPALERVLGAGDAYAWQPVGPDDPGELGGYVERRRARDRDLWVIELDADDARAIADAAIG